MAKSKTKIDKQMKRKTNPELAEVILLAKKNPVWISVAESLSSPRRIRVEKNLEEINKEAEDGEVIIVPGKVLSQGNIDKKVKIAAFKFSQSALDKLNKSKIEAIGILEEIKKNPGAKNVRILR